MTFLQFLWSRVAASANHQEGFSDFDWSKDHLLVSIFHLLPRCFLYSLVLKISSVSLEYLPLVLHLCNQGHRAQHRLSWFLLSGV